MTFAAQLGMEFPICPKRDWPLLLVVSSSLRSPIKGPPCNLALLMRPLYASADWRTGLAMRSGFVVRGCDRVAQR